MTHSKNLVRVGGRFVVAVTCKVLQMDKKLAAA